LPHMSVSPGLITLGLIEGITYGILAAGLILVFRTSRVINFAHGEIGALGAAVAGVVVVRWHIPYWIALLVGIAISGGVGGLTEIVVVRRLRSAPKVMSLVATLGVAAFLLSMSSVVNSVVTSGSNFPQPPLMPQFHIGHLLVTRAYSAMLFLSPLVILALTLFLRYSRFGMALRAASANPERARLSGVSATRMSTLAWVIAGSLAGFTVILILPTSGFLSADVLGPTLLLRALIPAVIARMQSIPIALVAGMAVGVIDNVLVFNYPTSGVNEIVLLVLLLGALLLQSPRATRLVEKEDWSAMQPWPPLPEVLKQIWAIRNLGRIVAVVGAGTAIALGMYGSNATAVKMTSIVAFTLLGLSIVILTGLGGQISLGQFAVAGVGATASYLVAHHTGNFILALIAAVASGAVISVVLGAPALRVRGLLLAVITLSFALTATRWLLAQSWALGSGGVEPGRPHFGSLSLVLTKRYFLYSLIVLVFGMWLARNISTGGVGLRLRAQRDNEDAARAFSIPTVRVKQQGFLLAGALAGMGGAIYGHLLDSLQAQSFDVTTSINVVALTVLGGVGILSGPLLGALYIIGLPSLVALDSAEQAATSLGWLLLILYFPGGIAQALAKPRDFVIRWIASRAGVDVEKAMRSDDEVQTDFSADFNFNARLAPIERMSADPMLVVENLSKSYRGVRAVQDVSFNVEYGEIFGVIGPNGAGKTTMFEMLGGFTSCDGGRVVLDGDDISSLPADRRSRLGLIRSFQDAALFPTLTVHECVTLAFERAQPTNTTASLFGLDVGRRRKVQAADELIQIMGLSRFRLKQIRELSTGTRRFTELACLVALGPKVLLLDEPSSGIAQKESEALGRLLLRLREFLDTTILIIEHDIPLLMGISTRVMAMDTGTVIAIGDPAEVRNNPTVVSSYLGGDLVAIERSGSSLDATVPTSGGTCRARTRSGQPCSKAAGPDGLCPTHRRFAEVPPV
jgi:ABC-type branched-subunit amino acid transport system ATPase component/ABC-type branched-subunit amino acid transport system permease subunit